MAEPVTTDLLLSVESLDVCYGEQQALPAVRAVDLKLKRRQILGIAGESGSGKSTLAMAIARLLRPPARVTGGRVTLFQHDGQLTDVLSLSGAPLREYRWRRVSVVFQSAMNVLNPVLRVSDQLTDVMAVHEPQLSPSERNERAGTLLDLVGVDRTWLSHYPHELSGGMRQRVIIALALALRPELVIFDEPTTALDVVSQARILSRIRTLQSELGFAMVLITHDLPLLLCTCDRVAIMYAGKVVEEADADALCARPAHPYTSGLMRCFPSLRGPKARVRSIPGFPPRLSNLPSGCAFHPRCDWGQPQCKDEAPPLIDLVTQQTSAHDIADGTERHVACWRAHDVIVQQPQHLPKTAGHPATSARSAEPIVLCAEHVSKYFETGWQHEPFPAVQDVTLQARRASTLSVVGESGSGKTTLARILTGLVNPTSGTLTFNGQPVRTRDLASSPLRHQVQMVFQDPFAALNSAHRIRYHLARPLKLREPRLSKRSLRDRVSHLLEQVHLTPPEDFLDKFPYELSGGQLQRIVVAKALAAQPSVLVADEPISMLDVSIRVGILDLLEELKGQGLAIIYITHDIASARYFGDEMLVMYKGRVVEAGYADDVVSTPAHPYTAQLISAVPDIDFGSPGGPRPLPWSADFATPRNSRTAPALSANTGCPYLPQCPLAFERCHYEQPPLIELGEARQSRCFLALGQEEPPPSVSRLLTLTAAATKAPLEHTEGSCP